MLTSLAGLIGSLMILFPGFPAFLSLFFPCVLRCLHQLAAFHPAYTIIKIFHILILKDLKERGRGGRMLQD